MKRIFDHLFFANFKGKFVKKESKGQTFKKRFFASVIILNVLVFCLIAVGSLYIAGQQNTVVCQFALVGLEASARLLYSDLERRFKENSKKRKSKKNSPITTDLWITLEVLILCTICVVISYILVQQAPHSPFTHLKTLEG